MAEYSSDPTKAALTIEQVNQMVNPIISNGQINPAELTFSEWLSATDYEREQNIVSYRDYYNGESTQQLTDRMKQFLDLVPNVNFNYNFIPLAVDIVQERMAIESFEVMGEDAATPENERQGGEKGLLMQWFKASRMDAGQDEIHHSMLVDSMSYALAEWDTSKQIPVISEQEEYTGTRADGTGAGVYVAYKEENQKELKFAVKRWRINTGPNAGSTRTNVYTEDMVLKYLNGKLIEEPIAWPVGITMVPFETRKSLVHDLIPFQDAINKAAIDELAGADIEGFGMIALNGGEEPVDEDGNSTVVIGPGSLLYAPDGTYAKLPAGDVAALSALVDTAIRRLPQRARIPLTYFQTSGQVSSAASQNAEDSVMVSMIEGIARHTGNSWEDVMSACRDLYNAFSGKTPLPLLPISAKWASFERIDREEATKKQAETGKVMAETFDTLLMNNVERETAALLAGYPPEIAAEMAIVSRGNLDGEVTQ